MRAVLITVCVAHVTPKSSTIQRQRFRVSTYYNPTEFNLNLINNTLKLLPGIKASALLLYLCLRTVVIDPAILYLNKLGYMVKTLRQMWSVRPKRKPPYSVKPTQTRRKQLLQALLFLHSVPHIARGNYTSKLEAVGLISTIDPSKLDSTQAEVVRSIIRDSTNNEFLSSLNAINGVVDSGASTFSTFDRDDFEEGTYVPSEGETVMKGIAGGLKISGQGTVRYEVLDHHGVTQYITGTGLHIEGLPCRLIPPQKVMPTKEDGYYRINGDEAKFVFANNSGQVVTPIDSTNNLPTITLFRSVEQSSQQLATSLYACVADENNQNLSPTAKESLRWHFRLGHPGMAVIRWLAGRKMLGKFSDRLTKVQDCPKCATCQYGKQTRRPTGTTRTTNRPDKIGGVIAEKLEPGQEVACDQFEVKKRGRKFKTRGKEKEEEKYSGGTIFVDVATGFTRCYYQVSLGAEETIQSKNLFEREALSFGVVVRNYRSDNGIFSKTEFMKQIYDNEQFITFSGVGAHHQNGVAERAIRTVVTRARTMLLHAQLRWPDATSPELWPMAMEHASYLINIIPNINEGLSPEEKFARAFKPTNRLTDLPVWGCPTYVLEPTLQDGKKLPKWRPRSRRGQFVGFSTLHASNVPLVRNITTGSIGPQFHVVYDKWFETIAVDEKQEEPPEWDVIITHSRFEADLDPEDKERLQLDDEWLTKEELVERRRVNEQQVARNKRNQEAFERPQQQSPSDVKNQTSESTKSEDTRVETTITSSPSTTTNTTTSSTQSIDRSRVSDVETPTIAWPPRQSSTTTTTQSAERDTSAKGVNPNLRRSQRTRTKPSNLTYTDKGVASYLQFAKRVSEIKSPLSVQAYVAYWTMISMDPNTGSLDAFQPHLTPMALKATRKGKDPDTPTYREAMTGPHRKEFEKAMIKEIRDLEKRGAWTGVLKSSVPKGAQIVPLTWVFKIKRLPNGDFDKFKARICVRGDLQHLDSEVYAPVCKWATIRSVLAFAVKHDMKTRQIDFSNAFIQSELKEEDKVFVKLPQGFGYKEDAVLQLQRSLYGQRNSPLYWYNTVKETIHKLGFKSSSEDQCMFYHPELKAILLIYVDDCLVFAPDDKTIDTIISGLRENHDLDEQEMTRDVYGYLGIEVNLSGDNVELLQTGLIDKILKNVNMENCNPCETPAKEEFLTKDTDGEPINEEWDYASILGQLMYLTHTRPDIQFAVHQCARFTHDPKQSHANAIKKICRYIKGTRDTGIKFQRKMVDDELRINCFVDASFAPVWAQFDDPENARSQTGYVIRIDDVPVTWCSRKQELTALSSTEAELIAMSTAMRELLWIRRLVADIAKGFGVAYNKHTMIKSTVFEDNEGAIHLSKRPDMTPRTRHLSVKYTQFKENLGVDKDGNGISVAWVPTELQIGDVFTKGVGPLKFKPLRDLLMGWSVMSQAELLNCGARKGELKSNVSLADRVKGGQTGEDRSFSNDEKRSFTGEKRRKSTHKINDQGGK